MESVIGPLGLVAICISLALAAMAANGGRGRWGRPLPVPVEAPRPIDREPHTLIMLSAEGRPNPLAYENHPDYASALKRQAELRRIGRDSVLTHTESGEVRLDLAAILGPYRQFSL